MLLAQTALAATTLVFSQVTIPLDLPFGGTADQQADVRLQACLLQADADPAAAIATAREWLAQTSGPAASAAQECLGFGHVGAQAWGEALDAFVAARDALLPGDLAERARLGAMAGNAALAGGLADRALAVLQQAQTDAAGAGDSVMAGAVSADRARALVALGQPMEGAQALATARDLAPQEPGVWLLSATLARRMDDLVSAAQWIGTAAALNPRDPAVALEAGLIAALAGDDATARREWQRIVSEAPDAPEADPARDYLAQLGEAESTTP